MLIDSTSWIFCKKVYGGHYFHNSRSHCGGYTETAYDHMFYNVMMNYCDS